MRTLPAIAALALVLATTTSVGAGEAQEAVPEPPTALFTDETSVAWVLVPVTVKDGRGAFVTDLERRHFRLRIDGRPTRFESFDAEAAAPISLIHLQDLSGSMAVGGKLQAARTALKCFAETMRPMDEIAVASFGAGQLGVEVPFTSVNIAAQEAAQRWQAYGTTALYDAVAWLPEIGLAGRYARRAAVLITDGADNASALPAATAQNLVRQARLPVYVLALDTPQAKKRQRKKAADGDDSKSMSNRALLEALADATGGRFFAIDSSATAAESACSAIATELRHQYVLGLKIAADMPKADHRLQVEVAHARSLVITHRASYRGGLP